MNSDKKGYLRRRILSLLLAFSMIATLIPITAGVKDVEAKVNTNTETVTVKRSDGSTKNYDVTLTKTAKWNNAAHTGNDYDATITLNFSGFTDMVEEEKQDVVLILDTSRSMSGERALACAAGAKNFVSRFLSSFTNSRIAITAFNGKAQSEGSPYCSFNRNIATLNSVIESAYCVSTNGVTNIDSHAGTNYEAGFRSAYSIITRDGVKPEDTSLVFFSDGQANQICTNGDITSPTSTTNAAALTAAEVFINNNFSKTEIFAMSYGVTGDNYIQAMKDIASSPNYYFNDANYAGNVNDVFVNMFDSVMKKMQSLPVTLYDYVSEYYQVDTAKITNTDDMTYKVTTQSVDGKSLQLVTVNTVADTTTNLLQIKIPVTLKSAYRTPGKNATYPTNYDRNNNPGARMTFSVSTTGVNTEDYAISVTSPSLYIWDGNGGGGGTSTITNDKTITVTLPDGTTRDYTIYLTKSAGWEDENHENDNYNGDINFDFTGFSDIAKTKRPDVILILDTSTSMSGNPALACAAGAKNFVSLFQKRFPESRIAVTAFNGGAQREGSPFCSFTQSAATLDNVIDTAYEVANGGKTGITSHYGTNYEAGFRSAHKIMTDAGLNKNQVSLVFFSDGAPNSICTNGDMTQSTMPGYDVALPAATSFISNNFNGTEIFSLSYSVTNANYQKALQDIASEDPATGNPYYFNTESYDGAISDQFTKLFQAVITSMMSVPISVTDYISEYFEVDKTRLPDDPDLNYTIDTETVDGKKLQKVTISFHGDIDTDTAMCSIPIKLKDNYQKPTEDMNYATNYDRANDPGAKLNFYVQINNNDSGDHYDIDVTSPTLFMEGINIELTLTKTKYQLPMGDGRSTAKMEYTLSINGTVVTDANILKNVEFTTDNYGRFAELEGLKVGTIDEDGIISAEKSGVTTISASYMGVSATNTAVLIVPGDVNGDGYVAVSDAAQVAAVLRGTVNPDREYIKELCDTNCDGDVTVADASIIAAMVRGTAGYNNSFY